MKIKLEEFLKDLTPNYLDERRKEIPDLETLIKSKDFQAIKKKFHKLAGSGGGYGLDELSNLSKEIENHADLQEYDHIEQLFDQYKDYISKVEIEF